LLIENKMVNTKRNFFIGIISKKLHQKKMMKFQM
jgi:hypothetical protein